jgi:pyridoxamine 5'-phosphate oxidase family protein
MSVFSEVEIAYLQSKTMGRLATISADGRPHLVPLTYRFNAEEDAIDIGGIDFANSKKWRDMLGNPHVAFLVDDASVAGAHAIEIRGNAEPHFSGGESINPGSLTSNPSSSGYDRTASSAGDWKPRASRRWPET